MKDFKPGDIVLLKSGGPFMTVARVIAPDAALSAVSLVRRGDVVCVWFSEAGVLHEANFRPEVLKQR